MRASYFARDRSPEMQREGSNAMTDPTPIEHRLRSSDVWLVAALYAKGFPIVGVDVEDGKVFFTFPDGGENLAEAVDAHRNDRLKVPTMTLRRSFYHVRGLIDELRHAAQQ
jgi:hypothetical protein